MGSYITLARKWRPAQFSDIVGQGHIVRTLTNAILFNRLHQGYLFTGSRGIGKTSIARIFAKILRCPTTKETDIGGSKWLRSCDECSSCKEITQGNSVDVIEIDGASNNGVDAVREIRENAKYLPSSGARKIYIIDEVHMLTTAAFNALLKTLEEPPPHVFFIFATTEPHKIPATVLSRVQRFDFKRVTVAQIETRLTEVLKAEGIDAESGAIALLARAADGSMRDALSLLDQVIAFAGKSITIQAVRSSIGLIGGETIIGILRGILSRQPLNSLKLIEETHQNGYDLKILTHSLIEFLHATILIKVGATKHPTGAVSEQEWQELITLASSRELGELELIFQVLHYGAEQIAHSSQPKVLLDIMIVKCATADTLIQIDDVSTTAAAIDIPTKQKPETAAVSNIESIETSTAQTTAKTWNGFVEHVRGARPVLASLLDHASSASLPGSMPENPELLTIHFKPEHSYKCDQLQSKQQTEQLLTLATAYFGLKPMIKPIVKEGLGNSLAEENELKQQEKEQTAKDMIKKHPIIQEAKALFGGELGQVELFDAD